MSYDAPFACLTTDNGPASELVHVSPIFTRFGPSRRGSYADRRIARVRRTEARWARFRSTAEAYAEPALADRRRIF